MFNVFTGAHNIRCGLIFRPLKLRTAPVFFSSFSQSQKPILIRTGNPISDRKSKFVAHIARTKSVDAAKYMVEALKNNKKIASATHNMVAYRISDSDTGQAHEYRDDDGERGGGDRILTLLQRMEVINVTVVVTRWYGGVQLGQDRFKHITSCVKSLVDNTLPVWPEIRQIIDEVPVSSKALPASKSKRKR